mmetsp:Transcript_28083/g.66942  ORF Transcript_28083/g.66942 Transcript_28083/m.66942 type:complete len:157 (-) Transcript_28083:976-1446(-)
MNLPFSQGLGVSMSTSCSSASPTHAPLDDLGWATLFARCFIPIRTPHFYNHNMTQDQPGHSLDLVETIFIALSWLEEIRHERPYYTISECAFASSLSGSKRVCRLTFPITIGNFSGNLLSLNVSADCCALVSLLTMHFVDRVLETFQRLGVLFSCC